MWPPSIGRNASHESSPEFFISQETKPYREEPTKFIATDSVVHTGMSAFLISDHLKNLKAWGLCVQNGCMQGPQTDRHWSAVWGHPFCFQGAMIDSNVTTGLSWNKVICY